MRNVNLETEEVIKSHFYNIFNFKQSVEIENLGPIDLLIHIRSGDLFKPKNPPERYTVPPLKYYCDIINKYNFAKIHLICEDKNNPCIDKLLSLYPSIIYKKRSVDEDIQLILLANNIITSVGTFIPSVLWLKPLEKKRIFLPWDNKIIEDMELIYPNNNEIIILNYNDFRKLIYPWKNTDKQRQLLLEYYD
jgi:hypothetical protein